MGKPCGKIWGITQVKDLDINVIPVFAVLVSLLLVLPALRLIQAQVLCILSPEYEVSAMGHRTGKNWQQILELYIGEFSKLQERKREQFFKVMDLFDNIVFNGRKGSRDDEDLGNIDTFQESTIFEDSEAPSLDEADEADEPEFGNDNSLFFSPNSSPRPQASSSTSFPITPPRPFAPTPEQRATFQAAARRPRPRIAHSAPTPALAPPTAPPPAPNPPIAPSPPSPITSPLPLPMPPAPRKPRATRGRPKSSKRATASTEHPHVPLPMPAVAPPTAPLVTPLLNAVSALPQHKAKKGPKPAASLALPVPVAAPLPLAASVPVAAPLPVAAPAPIATTISIAAPIPAAPVPNVPKPLAARAKAMSKRTQKGKEKASTNEPPTQDNEADTAVVGIPQVVDLNE